MPRRLIGFFNSMELEGVLSVAGMFARKMRENEGEASSEGQLMKKPKKGPSAEIQEVFHKVVAEMVALMKFCRMSNGKVFLLSAIYGPPVLKDRAILWNLLSNVNHNNLPWITFGDFNQVGNASEKLSRNKRISGAADLNNTINSCGLINIPSQGLWFTWSNNRRLDDQVRERLDRAYCNHLWFQDMDYAWVETLPIAASDHAPLVIHTEPPNVQAKTRRGFKFEVMWMHHLAYNILIANELVHYLNQCKKGKTSWAAMKVDVSKAYDKVSWTFLRELLTLIQFPHHWVTMLMECVTTPMSRVLINGEFSDWFHPKSGLQQGDPISPYLFILCANALSVTLFAEQENHNLQGIKISREAPPVNHMCYADDIMLFFKANMASSLTVRNIFQNFGQAFGLYMNPAKTEVKFSPNTSQPTRNDCLAVLQCADVTKLGTYLGSHIDSAGKDRANYEKIHQHLLKRLQGWKTHLLSQAARYTLIHSVMATIPIYYLQFTKLTKAEARSYDKVLNNFFWGHGHDQKGLHMIYWDRVCHPRTQGGLGLRRFDPLNQCLLGKQFWRIITNQNPLLSNIYQNGFQHLDWMAGNGSQIRFTDPLWIQSDYQNHPYSCARNLMWNGRRWDMTKLRQVYSSQKATVIAKRPISYSNQPDRIVWKSAPSGQYNIKEACRMLMSCTEDTPANSLLWKRLWASKLPFRYLMFCWRLLNKGLPLGTHPVRRGYSIAGTCPFGCPELETEDHIFQTCSFARAVWFGSGLAMRMDRSLIVCWSIYYHRNQVLFNNGKADPLETVGLLRQVVNKVSGTRNMDDLLLRPLRFRGPYREVPVCFMEGWCADQVLDLHIHWQNFISAKRRGLSMWLKKRHHL
ncbi:ribonuclease H [Senna tora]|uniref:Ribonuclease H n=1 Tax=Senna tora TaxID=362788 RepID=A0A834TGG6_9FABA|nr:ribonuclease H [Senna tora]